MSRTVIAAPVLLCALALAACGSATQQGSGNTGSGSTGAAQGTPAARTSSPASSPSSSPAATPDSSSPAGGGAAAAPAGCATSHLAIAVNTKQSGGTAGSVYYPIDFTNTGTSKCTLFGYPGVSFVASPGGHEIGSPASRHSGSPSVTVTLAPGGHAHAILQVVDAGNYSPSACHPVTAHWLRVYPPNQTRPGYARFTTQVCSARLPRNLGSPLSVYPVRGGKGQRGQAP